MRACVRACVRACARARLQTGVIGLVEGRKAVSSLLEMDDLIDLVIPRGSSQLVEHIKANTHIAVLGHSEGVCHVFVDIDEQPDVTARVVIDSKCDYPAACNASETLLLHIGLLETGRVDRIIGALRSNGTFIQQRLAEIGVYSCCLIRSNQYCARSDRVRRTSRIGEARSCCLLVVAQGSLLLGGV